jgi:hypothetical protein
MLKFTNIHPRGHLGLGLIPDFLSPDNPAKARDQLDSNYKHGGGWSPRENWRISNKEKMTIRYPGDPPLTPLAFAKLPLTDETIYIYPLAFVLILQSDGSFEVARMD